MPKERLIKVFKTGKHTDSAGKKREWTKADLDKIINSFNELGEDVAWCTGHPNSDSPALAWCKKVVRKGKYLFADFSDVTERLDNAIKEKMFKKVSIALRDDLSVRHIGLLGAQPPAVKGLNSFSEDIQIFAFGEKDEFSTFDNMFEEGSFTEDMQTNRGFRAIARVLQGLRDHFIEKESLEKANMLIPQWDVDNIKDAAIDPTPDPMFSENLKPINKGNKMPTNEELSAKITELTGKFSEQEAKITGLESKNTEFAESNKTLTAKNAELETTIKTAEKETKEAAYTEFAEMAIDKKRILPSDKSNVIAMLRTNDNQEAIDFSEGEKTVKKTPYEIYKNDVMSRIAPLSFGESFANGKGEDNKKSEIDTKINKIITDEKLTFGEASRKLRGLEPTLFEGLEITESQE